MGKEELIKGMTFVLTSTCCEMVSEVWEDDTKYRLLRQYVIPCAKNECGDVIKKSKSVFTAFDFPKFQYDMQDVKNYIKGGSELMIREKLFGIGKTVKVEYGKQKDVCPVQVGEWTKDID